MVNVKKGGRRAPMANPVKLVTPGSMDILCGKDRACALHQGSQRFRAVIDSYRANYQKATTKYDKMQITKEIYELLSQDSRFLKYNDKEKVWEEITPLAGRDKIGHALRFANNNLGAIKPKKKPKKALMMKASNKADLVASLVEVAKEEPKVWNQLVDHLTLQDVLTSVPDGGGVDGASVDEEQAHAQQAVANAITDPVALENIAYAVDCKTDDTALDELINLLNNEDIVSEEHLHDVLAAAESNLTHSDDVQPSVSFHKMPMPIEETSSGGDFETAAPVPYIPAHHRRRSSATSMIMMHKRGYSADDDMWSVMNEPLMDLDWR